MADTQTPQGLLAVCRDLRPPSLDEVLAAGPPASSCVLAHVRDPGNAGTVIRGRRRRRAPTPSWSATASVDVYNPKVVRVDGRLAVPPAGRHRHARADGRSQRLRGVGAAPSSPPTAPGRPHASTSADLADWPPHAWVFGNEAWGLPAEDSARSPTTSSACRSTAAPSR